MGHYRSEMITDDQVVEEKQSERTRRKRLVRTIEADIEKRGIAEVLADIVDDPNSYRFRVTTRR